MKVTVFHVDSFCIDGKGGNPAGVVLDAENLSLEQRKNIALHVGFSETAFVEKSNNANFKVTFFTPEKEIDFCGHATIAVYTVLFQKGFCCTGKYSQELKVGTLPVEVKDGGFILMDQILPVFSEIISHTVLHECIQSDTSFEEIESQIVSTGVRDILVPIRTIKELDELEINYQKLSELNKLTDTVGLHAFLLESTGSDIVAYTRNFAPLYGIDEESATGSSNGALACYLFTHGKLRDRDTKNLRFRQGYQMGMPSEILVTLETVKEVVTRVQVGGYAVIKGEREVEL